MNELFKTKCETARFCWANVFSISNHSKRRGNKMNTLPYQYSIETSTFDAIKTTSLSQFLENQYWIERYKYHFLSPSPVQPITEYPLPSTSLRWEDQQCNIGSCNTTVGIPLYLKGPLRKSQESEDYRGIVVYKKLRFQNSFRPYENETPGFSNSSDLNVDIQTIFMRIKLLCSLWGRA